MYNFDEEFSNNQARFSVSNFINRDQLNYIDPLWKQFKEDPDSVGSDWRYFFEGLEFAGINQLQSPFTEKEGGLFRLVQTYRQYGYLEADLNPLKPRGSQATLGELFKIENYGLSKEDLETSFSVTSFLFGREMTLAEVLSLLKKDYMGSLAVQCGESLPSVHSWFYEHLEKKQNFRDSLSTQQKQSFLRHLSRAESFEKFLHSRFVGAKRFSIEGGDSLLPMLEWLTEVSSSLGLEEMIMGMAHRGRLNCLTRYFEKPVQQLLTGFLPQELDDLPFEDFDGDVKYHLGYRKEKKTASGSFVVSLAFNPSHLEAVNTVVLGMTRAAQRLRGDTEHRTRVLPILIHGDAAFAGQGIVQETLQMSQVKGYRVGGCIHIIIDNQVGFTAKPESSRSTVFSSDVAKMIQAPVIHVNGDDVESCVQAMDLALKYRQKWHSDIIINMVCYRRYGHNEGDEPSYTQSQMYQIIKNHPTPRDLYQKQLIQEGIVTQQEQDQQWSHLMNELDESLAAVRAKPVYVEPYKFEGPWKGLRKAQAQDFEASSLETGFPLSKLEELALSLSTYPEGFNPHPKLLKMLEQRAKVTKGQESVDWGLAELLAFGTLLEQGYHVRLTGQDSIRGTFSHRHAGLYDTQTGDLFMALKEKYKGKSEFCVYDSVLSEYGVMGFEYGNSLVDPRFLTLWEAQFGDFSNGAQIMIDQFLSSAESKWQQMSGLVLLLPHGYEGQGPEHSSARLERYLQLCAQNNMQVIVPTTPAQIYHAYRRQMLRPFRKPLIVISPKSLLRHPKALSSLEELAQGCYQEIIVDSTVQDPKDIETLVLCCGKLYYDLDAQRQINPKKTTAIVRVEQLYPAPMKQIGTLLKSYPRLKNIVWAQEEPKNMGAYQFIYFRLSEMLFREGLAHLSLHYVGRPEKASPATGSPTRHKLEQEQIVKGCFLV
jgi:2-oxoglutarate dehydrogenase E1 component